MKLYSYRFFILFVLLQTIIFSSVQAGDKCIYRRYIFDIGSSTTKGAAYTVNTCKKTIISSDRYHLQQNYKFCLINHGNNDKGPYKMPKDCMERGIEVLEKLQDYYGIDCKKNKCIAFATAWARHTSNIEEWFQEIKTLGINPHVFSQEKEGVLAFKAVENKAANYNSDRSKMLVLDIGGGSTQISGFNNQTNSYFSYKGDYGSDSFLDYLLKKFKPEYAKLSSKDLIINPIMFNNEEIDEIIEHSNKFWSTSIGEYKNLTDKIANSSTNLIGMGVFMTHGLRKQMKLDKEIITKDDVLNFIKSVCGLSKEQVLQEYPELKNFVFSCQSSMLILYSIMNALKVDSFRIVDEDVMAYIALNPKVVE